MQLSITIPTLILGFALFPSTTPIRLFSVNTEEIKSLMKQAIRTVLQNNNASIPEGRQDILIEGNLVRVYGARPNISNITVVQTIIEGRGYSSAVGKKSGKLGKLETYTP